MDGRRDSLSLEPNAFSKRGREHIPHRQWWTTGGTERRQQIHTFSSIEWRSLNYGGHDGVGPILMRQRLQVLFVTKVGT